MSSLGDFSSAGSFGAAFNQAHAAGGQGHTFTYNDKLYSTKTRDGGDYRAKPDNRSVCTHAVHAVGHDLNAWMKDNNAGSLDGLYGKRWSSDVDRQRSEYHRREIAKKSK